jgi:hypothetical protein
MIKSLDDRVAKLKEKDSSITRMFVENAIAPLLVLMAGIVITEIVQRGEHEVNQIQVAQALVPDLFSADRYRALATKRLLDR